jgi:hypothetical protein
MEGVAARPERWTGAIRLLKLLRPFVEAGLVFVWIGYLLGVLMNQNYDGNLTFDLFLARVGGPTDSHATSYLIFLSVFPISYLILRSIIPAFLVEALAFEIHEGLWQIPYYVSSHSIIDWRIWVLQDGADAITTVATIAVLVFVYHFPARFFAVVTVAWASYLSAWLSLGFPVSVLSKLPDNQITPSIYNNVLWVNQIEVLSWAYIASVVLICLRFLVSRYKAEQVETPQLGADSDHSEREASILVQSAPPRARVQFSLRQRRGNHHCSTTRPGTRPKSLRLRVTSFSFCCRAIEATMRSKSPIGSRFSTSLLTSSP